MGGSINLVLVEQEPKIAISEILGGEFDGEQVVLINFGVSDVPLCQRKNVPAPISFGLRSENALELAQKLLRAIERIKEAENDRSGFGPDCDDSED